MNFDVYWDESRPEALTSKSPDAARYLIIGSLWLPPGDRQKRKEQVHAIKSAGKIGGESQWPKVLGSPLAAYQRIVDWFFDAGQDLQFRAGEFLREKRTAVISAAVFGEMDLTGGISC